MKPLQKIQFLLFLTTIFLIGVSAKQPSTIKVKFGINSTDSAAVVGKRFLPVMAKIEQYMTNYFKQPVKVNFKVFRTYDDAIEGVVKGQVDFARLGPASYIVAKKQNPNIRLLVMGNRKGKKRFNGLIIVHKDSPIRKLNQLKGGTFGFGNKVSTIGRYLSQRELVKAGVCAKDLAKFEYLNRHDNVFSAVASKSFDAGALKESTFHKRNKKKGNVRVLHSFTNVTKPWVVKEGLDEKIYKALQLALLNLKDKSALKALKSQGFFPTSHEEYKFIELAMQNTHEFDNCQKSK